MIMFPESVEAIDLTQSHSSNSLVFIDAAVDNPHILAAASPHLETIILDSAKDGIAQISEALAQRSNLSSIHIVSHGEPGSLHLGSSQLNLATLVEQDHLVSGWSESLANNADLLLYGCEVGAQASGQALLEELSRQTGADVAASTDLTGNSTLGGDWNLEATVGAIETDLAFQAGIEEAYDGVLADEAQEDNMNVVREQLLNLVPEEAATHVAIKDGDWSDGSVWDNGDVPDDGADVVIPEAFEVIYDVDSEARLDTLRVDGSLEFARNQDTQMLIDTFVVTPGGQLTIGTESNPIQGDRTAQIIFTDDGSIDQGSDPTLLSRGLISQGRVTINGADKLDFAALQGDASQGDSELVLSSTPTGWKVGDRLVLGGTSYDRNGSNQDNTRFQDEELTITAIDGNRIRFTNDDITSGNDSVLRFDHQRPEGLAGEELQLYVANTTRNVRFESENGDSTPFQQRGHVMLMRNPDAEVNNAGFYHLGRSDKSKLVDDPEENVDGSNGTGTNRRGRYPLHFHRTGVDDINSTPSRATGNAVVGSPGWGIVHHDSHAVLEDNVVFDVVGSGIVAESGNEIGAWRNNLTIKTTGDNRQQIELDDPARNGLFDMGFEGEGYWVQGAAQVAMEDNIAVSAAGGGVNIFSGTDIGSFNRVRDAETVAVANLLSDLQGITEGQQDPSAVDVTNVPLRKLSGFESYNSLSGIIFWNHMRNDDGRLDFSDPGLDSGHYQRSLVEDFKLWNISSSNLGAIHTQYSTQIDFVDGVIGGVADGSSLRGVTTNPPSQDLLFKDIHVEGFENGLEVPREGGPLELNTPYAPVPSRASRLENSAFAKNDTHLSEFRSAPSPSGGFMFPDYFEIDNTTFSTPSNNAAPTATFDTEAAGGLAIHFDASQSFDPDIPDSSQLSNYGIVSYGWDFDNDGSIDEFGRELSHIFEQAGSYQVTLKVWDNQGETATSTQTVDVQQSEYPNLLVDSEFGEADEIPTFHSANSRYADQGWLSNELNGQAFWSHDASLGDGGAAVLTGRTPRAGMAIGQVLLDNEIRRGEQTLSLDIKNTEGNRRDNRINIQVWGVDGEFNNEGWSAGSLRSVGALPMASNQLLNENVGGSTFDWKTFNWNVDFDEGYEFVFVKVTGALIAPQEGDYVAIDNVKLDGEPISAQPEVVEPEPVEQEVVEPDLVEEPVEQEVVEPDLVEEPVEQEVVEPDLVEEPIEPDQDNSGLVMQLDFEDTGSTATDSSSQGDRNQGELRNGATFQEEGGEFGSVVNFDGNNDLINVNDSLSLNLDIRPQRTISFWFKTDDKSITDRKQVLYEEGGMTRGLNLYLADSKLYFGGWNVPELESGWEGTYLSTDAIADDTWHHVALVLDTQAGVDQVQSDGLVAYLDGVKIGSGEGSQLRGHGDDIGLGGLNEGTRFHDGTVGGTGTQGFKGNLDAVRVYNQALTAQEVSQLAANPS